MPQFYRSPLSCFVLASLSCSFEALSFSYGNREEQSCFFHLICIIHDLISFHQKTYTGHCQPWQVLGGIHANLSLQHHSLVKLTVLSDRFPTSLERLTEVPWPTERAAQTLRGLHALLQDQSPLLEGAWEKPDSYSGTSVRSPNLRADKSKPYAAKLQLYVFSICYRLAMKKHAYISSHR